VVFLVLVDKVILLFKSIVGVMEALVVDPQVECVSTLGEDKKVRADVHLMIKLILLYALILEY